MVTSANQGQETAGSHSLHISPELAELAKVRSFIGEICRLAGLSPERTFDVQVAVSEATANAIEHAESEVDITCYVLPDRLLVEVTNRGTFQPSRARDSGRRRGWGLPHMVSLADQVHVAQLPGDITRVSLTFFTETSAVSASRPAAEAAAPSAAEATVIPAPRPPAWVLALLPVFAIAVGVVAMLRPPHAYYAQALSTILAILFLTAAQSVVAALAARGYLRTGSEAVLLLGCGSLALGFGALLASATGGSALWDAMTAIHTAAAVVAGLCHVAAALVARSGWSTQRPRRATLAISYLSVLVLLSVVTALVQTGGWARQLVQWSGMTLFGLSVTRTAAAFFVIAAIVMAVAPGISRDGFRQWYAGGLGLLGIGLAGMSAQLAVGDVLYWLGSATQYAGSLLIACGVFLAVGKTGAWIVPLERALRETEERYRVLVDQSPDAILVDVKGKTVFANPAAARLFGARSPADLVDQDALGRVHPDDRETVRQRMNMVVAGGTSPPRELKMLRLDGTPFTVEVTASRVHFDGAIGNQVVMHDVTERRKAETALRDSEFFYRQTLESIPGMVFTARPDGYCDYESQQWADYTGVPVSEQLGTGWKGLLHPDDPPRAFAVWQRAVKGEMPYDLEYRVRRYDGKYEWFKVISRPIRDAEGRVVKWFGTAINIEDLKRAEEQLRLSEERYRSLAEENERLYSEQLRIAEDLQEAFRHVPSEVGRLRLAHLYRSATEAARVGGDFYDVFELKDNKVVALIGDVSGHGIQAARAATLVKDVVHAFVHQALLPEDVLARTNQLLIANKAFDGFVTLFLGLIDVNSGLLRYASAAHPETILRRRHNGLEILGSASYPLGVFPEATWKDQQVELDPGDVLLLYTDGVIEARARGELFGEDRLRETLLRSKASVEALPEFILSAVLEFTGGSLQDDVAIVALSLKDDKAEAIAARA